MKIRERHQRAIDRLADAYRNDPEFLSLIIGGSVAKGFARDDSDVDFMIVATDESFERRMASRDLFINRRDLTDYEGGYVDGKVVNLAYLEDVAAKGNEPSRAAFEGAFVACSRLPELGGLIERIPVYPEAGHDERINAYLSIAFIQHCLINVSERHGNPYSVLLAASQLSLFAGRLILAHNRRLFPYHKWLPRTLESVAEKPADFMGHFHALVERPNGSNAAALFDCIRNYRDWGVTDLDAYTWFMLDVEWSWMSGSTPMEDW